MFITVPVSATLRASMLLLVAAALLVSVQVRADINKWVDRDGQVHYGDQPPAWADAQTVRVVPNVIETDPPVAPAVSARRPLSPRVPIAPTVSQRRKDMEAYITLCRSNRGVDCEREARAMIDGPATVLFPGDPLIFPRPDLRSPPPPPPRPVPEKL